MQRAASGGHWWRFALQSQPSGPQRVADPRLAGLRLGTLVSALAPACEGIRRMMALVTVGAGRRLGTTLRHSLALANFESEDLGKPL